MSPWSGPRRADPPAAHHVRIRLLYQDAFQTDPWRIPWRWDARCKCGWGGYTLTWQAAMDLTCSHLRLRAAIDPMVRPRNVVNFPLTRNRKEPRP